MGPALAASPDGSLKRTSQKTEKLILGPKFYPLFFMTKAGFEYIIPISAGFEEANIDRAVFFRITHEIF
jgi:elongation factor P hydroxylase